MNKKTQKILSMLLTILLCTSLFTFSSLSGNALQNNSEYEYTVLEDDTVVLSAYLGNETDVVIPGEIDGKTVTSLFHYLFKDKTEIESITIPSSISTINAGFIDGCTSLKTFIVDANNSNFTVKNNALFGKEENAFTVLVQYPYGLTNSEYTIPEGTKRIEENAFDKAELSKIIVPSSLVTIGNYAFYRCKKLTAIQFAAKGKLKTIASGAFSDCSALIEMNIPKTVSFLASDVFYGCTSLKKVSLSPEMDDIYPETFRDCTSLSEVDIPAGIMHIQYGAFLNCSSLKVLLVPYSVTRMEDHCFGYKYIKEQNEYVKYPDVKLQGYTEKYSEVAAGYAYYNDIPFEKIKKQYSFAEIIELIKEIISGFILSIRDFFQSIFTVNVVK